MRNFFLFFYLSISEKSRTFAHVIEFERHIEILLLSNDCVIVPGLGGFMAHRIDACYDEEESIFLPPLRTLGFNPQLTMNDSLLVQSYIETYDISYPEALRRIEAEVAELRQHLETAGEYELNDIGILKINEEGKLQFEPCEAGILTPQFYGLSSFEMKPLPIEIPDVSETTEKDTDVEASEKEGTIIIKMSWLRNMAAVAAAIVAFLIISTPISNSNVSSDVHQSAFIPTPQQSKVEILPGNDTIQEAAPIEVKDATVHIVESTEPTVQEAPVAPVFCIVLASQVTKHNAELFIDQLNHANFTEARMLTSKNNMLRVVYGQYASESEAVNNLRSLRRQSKQFEQAWVMEIKD